jgi:hypothetical protein
MKKKSEFAFQINVDIDGYPHIHIEINTSPIVKYIFLN